MFVLDVYLLGGLRDFRVNRIQLWKVEYFVLDLLSYSIMSTVGVISGIVDKVRLND